ncbi:hypothetical protein KIN20_012835 [Parelaphostrongylus tenuis]|uniref:Uncharacterized protein n=1 Tax=Parelaphostrongylus tenuis TaxID=148309 RepID=A0AAD5QKJ6_PARTN|nr:hypothetical protein KIN20_012835 [Parelaphostrongylus tenuis]
MSRHHSRLSAKQQLRASMTASGSWHDYPDEHEMSPRGRHLSHLFLRTLLMATKHSPKWARPAQRSSYRPRLIDFADFSIEFEPCNLMSNDGKSRQCVDENTQEEPLPQSTKRNSWPKKIGFEDKVLFRINKIALLALRSTAVSLLICKNVKT